MAKTIDQFLMRNFLRLDPATTAGEVFRQLGGGTRGGNRYGVIVDPQGRPLSCLSTATVQDWPPHLPLHASQERWPRLLALEETEALDLSVVARFFSFDLFDHDDIPAVVVTDPAGQANALLLRRHLADALSQSKSVVRDYSIGAQDTRPLTTERDLMVKRWGRVQFPAQVALAQPVQLTVAIQRELALDQTGQVELGLTARRWPVYVVASLWVSEAEFNVVGPPVQVIEVPRTADSALHTFTVIPLRPGQAMVRVRFEQNNTYLGAAKVLTEVVETPPLAAGSAPVLNTPRLVADLQPPDVILYVKRVDPLTYAMSARLAGNDPSDAARELGRFAFPRPPEETIDALFADLDAKSKRKLPAAEFDDMLRKIGSSLFDSLSRGNDLRAFYWEQMHDQVHLGQSYWQPRELTAEYRSFGRTQPLVFLNACDTGRVGFGLTGLAGWAQAFLESGAGVFIGAMWKIDDKLAADFARIFYELIIQGVPVGDAVRQARESVRQPGDATWLSYTLYANPTVRATVASLVS